MTDAAGPGPYPGEAPSSSASPTGAEAVPVLTRSEEQLVVGAEWKPSRRLRVRKRIVTETRTYEVRREELVVEDLDAPAGGTAPGGVPNPLEIVLYQEQVSLDRVVVAVERVRVHVERVAGEAVVAARLAHEEIDAADAADAI